MQRGVRTAWPASLLLLLSLLCGPISPAAAQSDLASADDIRIAPDCDSAVTGRLGPETKRPLPRFESIKAGEANFRRGPGENFPIEWVLRLRGLPVCVISEAGLWRRVALPTGERGWMHAILLSESRYVLFVDAPGALFVAPGAPGEGVIETPAMTPIPLVACQGLWCKLVYDGQELFAKRVELWGVRLVDESR